MITIPQHILTTSFPAGYEVYLKILRSRSNGPWFFQEVLQPLTHGVIMLVGWIVTPMLSPLNQVVKLFQSLVDTLHSRFSAQLTSILTFYLGFYLTYIYILTFYLTYILTFYLAFYLTSTLIKLYPANACQCGKPNVNHPQWLEINSMVVGPTLVQLPSIHDSQNLIHCNGTVR